jgi:hypothetical protein
MSKKYMYARTTNTAAKITKPLNLNKHIIPDLLKDDEIKIIFDNEWPNDDSSSRWLTNQKGEKLNYIVFVEAENRENQYYEHLCNLNKYIKTNKYEKPIFLQD